MIVTADPRRRAWSPSDTSRKHLPAAISISSMYLPAALTASTAVKVLQERWFEQLNDMTLKSADPVTAGSLPWQLEAI